MRATKDYANTRYSALDQINTGNALSRSWPAKTLLTEEGGMLILEESANDFLVVSSGLTVTFERDPDVDAKITGIASIEEVSRSDGNWTVNRRLNGDQSNQGRQLSMAPRQTRIYRVTLYATDRASAVH